MVRRWSALALFALSLCLVLPAPRAAAAGVARPPTPASAAPAAEGTWQEHGTLADYFYSTWYDGPGDRLVALGDWDPGARVLPLGGAPAWQGLRGLPPNVFANHGNTGWDSETGDAYVLSFNADGTSQTLWRLTPGSAVTAVPVATSGTPPPADNYALVRFDHATQRLFVMGGVDPNTNVSEPYVHVLQLGPTPAWTTLTIPNPAVGSLAMYSDAVVDPARHQLVLVTGFGPDTVWTLCTTSPTGWTAVPVSFPSGTSPNVATSNGLVLDPDGDRLLGVDFRGVPWALSLGTAQWTPLGPAVSATGAHQYSSLAWDRARHHLLMNGGRRPDLTPVSDLWSLALDGTPAWTQLTADPGRPSLRIGVTAGYDPTRNRLVVTGGRSPYTFPIADPTWSLDLGSTPAWNPLATAGSPPASIAYEDMIYDPARDQFVFPTGSSTVATLSAAGATLTWGTLAAAGTAPPGRFGASVVYDSARDRFLLMFGTAAAPTDGPFLADVWELRLSPVPTWRQLAPGGTLPAPRANAMVAYDPAHDRVIVFGGVALPETLPTSTWELDLSPGDGTWQKLVIPDGPSGRRHGVFALDPVRGRLLLYGGYGFTNQPPPANRYDMLDDTWSFDLVGAPAWRALAPAGAPPIGSQAPLGAYDVTNDRLVLADDLAWGPIATWTLAFGGGATATDIALATRDVASDHVTLVWAGGTPGGVATAYRRVGASPWQALGALACDGLGQFTLTDRAVTPGTQLEYRLGLTTLSGERFVGATTVDVPVLALALRAGLTPDRRVLFTLQLPGAGTARLALYDVGGRRVWTRSVSASASGTQAVPVEPAGLGPGLYFARLQWGREVRGARVALVR